MNVRHVYAVSPQESIKMPGQNEAARFRMNLYWNIPKEVYRVYRERIRIRARVRGGSELLQHPPSSLPGMTRQSILLRKALLKIDGCAGQVRL